MEKLVIFITEVTQKYDDLKALEEMVSQEFSIKVSNINKSFKKYLQKMNGKYINTKEEGSFVIKPDGTIVRYSDLFKFYYGKILKFYVDKEKKIVRKYFLFHELVNEDYININRGFFRWYKVNRDEGQSKVCAYIEMDMEPEQYNFIREIGNLINSIRESNNYKEISFEDEEKFNFNILAFNEFAKKSLLSSLKINIKTDVLFLNLSEMDAKVSVSLKKLHEKE